MIIKSIPSEDENIRKGFILLKSPITRRHLNKVIEIKAEIINYNFEQVKA